MNHRPSLAEPAFPDDDGSTDPMLATAFAERGSGGGEAPILAVVGIVRLLVPIVALLDESRADGDKEADMAAVYMTGADGRKAILAFSSLEAMKNWDPSARPVSVLGAAAARAALDDDASALLLDLAGTDFTVIETDDLHHVAAGHQLLGSGWITS